MKSGVSIIEVILVVLLLGLVAALTVPRFSRASSADVEPDVRVPLSVLRNAIEMYYFDHGAYPGQNSDGTDPAGSAAAFQSQLTKFTDEAGRVADRRDERHQFGPYLRAGIPPCLVPPNRGQTGVAMVTTRPGYLPEATTAGWVYNCQTGDIVMNSDAVDAEDMAYDQY